MKNPPFGDDVISDLIEETRDMLLGEETTTKSLVFHNQIARLLFSFSVFERLLEGMISKSSALVLVSMGDFKGAFEQEKLAFDTFSTLLGPEHTLTKQSDLSLRQFLGAATKQGRGMVNHLEMRQKEEAANAIASEIEAEEAAAAEERGKKKNQKKKKGKK